MPRTLRAAELWDILHCNDLDSLYALFSEEEVEALLGDIKPPSFLKRKNLFTRLLSSMLLEESSLPFIMLWGIVGSVTIIVSSLFIVSAFTTALLILGTAVYAPITYAELKVEQQKNEDFFVLNELRTRCADLLINDYISELQDEYPNIVNFAPGAPHPKKESQPHQLAKEKENKLLEHRTHLKKSVGAGMSLTVILFGTYYIGVTAILYAFGLTTAFALLTGPIPIACALAVALIAGVYFGAQCYYKLNHESHVEREKTNAQDKLAAKQNKCEKLQILQNFCAKKPNNTFKQHQAISPYRNKNSPRTEPTLIRQLSSQQLSMRKNSVG